MELSPENIAARKGQAAPFAGKEENRKWEEKRAKEIYRVREKKLERCKNISEMPALNESLRDLLDSIQVPK
ncbi:hypothetical protein AgCh_036734 [Apium graveolens]